MEFARWIKFEKTISSAVLAMANLFQICINDGFLFGVGAGFDDGFDYGVGLDFDGDFDDGFGDEIRDDVDDGFDAGFFYGG